MAFYKDIKAKTRKEKQMTAQARGGFDDEGSRYSGKSGFGGKGKPSGNRNSDYHGQKGHGGRSFGDHQERRFDDRRSGGFHDRPQGGHKDSRSFDDHGPRRNGGRSFGDRRPGAFNDRPQGGPKGDRSFSGHGAPRGEMRFSKSAPRFEERGSRMAPPAPYAEQKLRRDEEFRKAPRFEGPAAYQTSMDEEVEVVPNENLLSGRNPIREALKSGRDIEKLLVARGELSGSAREIVQMAKERRIPVQEVERSRLDDITHNHQGMLAFASAYQYSTLEDMLELAEAREEDPFLILLDGITDPHNLGAIIRTAECVGAHGVIVQERRAVGLTPAAVKASAGAIEHIPVARVTNLTNTLETLKEKNIWAYAADMDGESYDTVNFEGGVALVIGAEGEGVSRRVQESCDKTVSLPMRGKLDSLNASVAAGILMYAVLRSR